MMRIRILVDDAAREPWRAEHGLSLLIQTGGETLLFDTGAGAALEPNFRRAKADGGEITRILLSHGHYDHTGGLPTALSLAPDAELFFAPGIDRRRFHLPADAPMREISMPESSRSAFAMIPPHKKREIGAWTQIAPQLFLTGPIPRISGETTGGAFFLDANGTEPDVIADEQALLWVDANRVGTLIQGCCHAGILNTAEFCRTNLPDVSLHTILGGLHLASASEERLAQTADYLNAHHVRRLVLLHCTGANAVGYFQRHFHGEVQTVTAGEVVKMGNSLVR